MFARAVPSHRALFARFQVRYLMVKMVRSLKFKIAAVFLTYLGTKVKITR